MPSYGLIAVPVGVVVAGAQEHAQWVVVGVAVATGDASMELDDPVDRFGTAVVRATGTEVAQVLLLPLPQGPAQAADLADRAGREGGHDVLGDSLAVAGRVGGVGRPNPLVAL